MGVLGFENPVDVVDFFKKMEEVHGINPNVGKHKWLDRLNMFYLEHPDADVKYRDILLKPETNIDEYDPVKELLMDESDHLYGSDTRAIAEALKDRKF